MIAMPAPIENRIFAREVGRLAFGTVLLAGVAWLAAVLVMGSFEYPEHLPLQVPAELVRFRPTQIVVATWLAAIAAGFVAHRICVRRGGPPGSGARFTASLIVPTAGVALLLPITLHLPVIALLSEHRGPIRLLAGVDFELWAVGSLWITWHAHLVFAGLAALRARQLAAGRPAIRPRAIYAATVLASCLPVVFLTPRRVDFAADMMRWVPHAELALVPPLVVAVTALPFVPLLRAMQRRTDRERAEIAAAQKLPRAVAVLPRRVT